MLMKLGVIYIHSEYIQHRLLVFNTFFMTTSNFRGSGSPLSKSGGGGGGGEGSSAPPLTPQVLCFCRDKAMHMYFHDMIDGDTTLLYGVFLSLADFS